MKPVTGYSCLRGALASLGGCRGPEHRLQNSSERKGVSARRPAACPPARQSSVLGGSWDTA